MGTTICIGLAKYTIIGLGITLAIGWNAALIAALMVSGVTVTVFNA